MSEIFARRLKKVRQQKGWTQKYLASQLGITNGAVSGYERSYRDPDLETLSKIAFLFNVSTDFLLGLPSDLHKQLYDGNGKIAEDLINYLGTNPEAPSQNQITANTLDLAVRINRLPKKIQHVLTSLIDNLEEINQFND